jgi:phytoene dehydrogenase-like protein
MHTGLISELAPYRLKDGGPERWYNYRFKQEHARQCLDTLRRYAPNIKDENILDSYICTPLDIENKFLDMKEGSIKQGAYLTLQMGYFRPNQYCSSHRTPIGRLYVCGASSYSGGTVIYGPGYLAANAIVEDLGIRKWWPEPAMVTKAKQENLL